MHGFGQPPFLRDLIEEAAQVFGCSQYDALVWVLKIEKESLGPAESKAAIQAAIDAHRRK